MSGRRIAGPPGSGSWGPCGSDSAGRRTSRELLVYPLLPSPDDVVRHLRERHGPAMRFALALVEHAGRLVLVRLRDDRLADRWLPPGGAVEPGETPEAAARREVREETGLDITLRRTLGVIQTGRVAPQAGVVESTTAVFAALAPGGELRPEDLDEVAEGRLATPDEVEALIAAGRFGDLHPYLRAGTIACYWRWRGQVRSRFRGSWARG